MGYATAVFGIILSPLLPPVVVGGGDAVQRGYARFRRLMGKPGD
jgi:hypothetical protein